MKIDLPSGSSVFINSVEDLVALRSRLNETFPGSSGDSEDSPSEFKFHIAAETDEDSKKVIRVKEIWSDDYHEVFCRQIARHANRWLKVNPLTMDELKARINVIASELRNNPVFALIQLLPSMGNSTKMAISDSTQLKVFVLHNIIGEDGYLSAIAVEAEVSKDHVCVKSVREGFKYTSGERIPPSDLYITSGFSVLDVDCEKLVVVKLDEPPPEEDCDTLRTLLHMRIKRQHESPELHFTVPNGVDSAYILGMDYPVRRIKKGIGSPLATVTHCLDLAGIEPVHAWDAMSLLFADEVLERVAQH